MSKSDIASIPESDAIAPDTTDLMTLKGRCFFKNAVVYRLPDDFKYTAQELETLLTKRQLTACGALDAERSGWINSSPLGRTVHVVNGQMLIALGNHKKIMPASMLRQELVRRCELLAAEQGIPVTRKQKRRLKEEVKVELLAKAMVRTTFTRAWIDTVNRWFVVEAASAARAEKLTGALRDTLETLAVTMLETEQAPAATMAGWLRANEAPYSLTLDTDLELQAEDTATVRYARHALDGDDIKRHLDAGKVVTRLGLTWNDRVSFVLTSKLEIKRICFLALVTEKESEEEAEKVSAEDQFDADMILMSDDLSQMLADLSFALGVTAKPADA